MKKGHLVWYLLKVELKVHSKKKILSLMKFVSFFFDPMKENFFDKSFDEEAWKVIKKSFNWINDSLGKWDKSCMSGFHEWLNDN